MKVKFVPTVKTDTVRCCADKEDLRVTTAIYGVANIHLVCGAMCVSGTRSGTGSADPGFCNSFCVACVDLEMYSADTTITCAANEGSKF